MVATSSSSLYSVFGTARTAQWMSLSPCSDSIDGCPDQGFSRPLWWVGASCRVRRTVCALQPNSAASSVVKQPALPLEIICMHCVGVAFGRLQGFSEIFESTEHCCGMVVVVM
jgi:hypothetical protein